jgi:alpha-tubulin suppressor-like RCC1 family protein
MYTINEDLIVLCSDGTIYSAGYNSTNRLTAINNGSLQFTRVSKLFKGIQTSGNLIVQSKEGEVHATAPAGAYALGINDTRSFANFYNLSQDTSFKRTSGGKQIVNVEGNATTSGVSQSYAYFLASDGSLFSTGYNVNGQLNDSTTTTSRVLKQVNNFGTIRGETVIDIHTTPQNAYFVTCSNKMAVAGDNANGQQGTCNTTTSNNAVVSTIIAPAPIIKPLIDQTVCVGGAISIPSSVTLVDSYAGNITYQWSLSATPVTVPVSANGNYSTGITQTFTNITGATAANYLVDSARMGAPTTAGNPKKGSSTFYRLTA